MLIQLPWLSEKANTASANIEDIYYSSAGRKNDLCPLLQVQLFRPFSLAQSKRITSEKCTELYRAATFHMI